MTSTQKRRIAWIDYAKGIGIFSVAALHILKGVIAADILTDDAALFIRDSWSHYSFNMPIFFFLGAMFVSGTLKKTWGRYFNDRLRTIFYPYIVWSLLTLLTGTVVAGYTNYDLVLDQDSLLGILYDPIQHFWFLYAIFVTVTTWVFLGKINASKYAFPAIAIALWFVVQFISDDMLYWVWGLMQYAVFFAFGALFSTPFRNWMQNTTPQNLTRLGVVGLGVWLFFVSQGTEFVLAPLHTFAAASGMLGILAVCALLDRAKSLRFIDYWGEHSLSIYLAHVMAGAAFRVALLHIFKIDNVLIHLVGGVLFAVYASLLLDKISVWLKFPYIFVIPKAPTTKSVSQNQVMPASSASSGS